MAVKEEIQVLVTGGSGFLGARIVKALAAKHPAWRLSVLDLNAPPDDVRKHIVQYLEADIRSAASVKNAFGGYTPDLVVHSAGIVPARRFRYSKDQRQWERVKAINYDGTCNVVDAALASGCRKLVYTSSCTSVIDDLEHDYYHMDETTPLGLATLHYGKSKGLAEQYVLDAKHADRGLKACALRPCTIIGPGDIAVISLIHDLIAKRETSFIIGDGDNLYDFMYIDNAVDAHVLAVVNLLTTQTAAGHAFFISNQEPVYFWDFLAAIWAQFGHVPKHRYHIPITLAWLAALVMELVTWLTGTAATIDTGSVGDSTRAQYSNNAKAQRILGYRPRVKLADGVRMACDDYKQYLAQQKSVSPANVKAKG
ncbi:RmlD substrate binding domain [Teratosphaeria destructans]|uniref:RmlD substrate binding domain n=1 Tax=Teratosphaeria destructans TaxID=418781 RepID=A0A9W7SZB8_9PEZI|nr:RmlD substrate binding domain [Teratosphaeria destructans]